MLVQGFVILYKVKDYKALKVKGYKALEVTIVA
jgi:hypothetical protein